MDGLTVAALENRQGTLIRQGKCYVEMTPDTIYLFYVKQICEGESPGILGNYHIINQLGMWSVQGTNLADLLADCQPLAESDYHFAVYQIEQQTEEVVRALDGVERYSVYSAKQGYGIVQIDMDGAICIGKVASPDVLPLGGGQPSTILSDWRQQGRPICYSERLVIGNGDFFKANVPVPISLKFPSRMYAVRPLVYTYIAQMQRRLIGRLWEKFADEDCVTSCA